jgi:hypothetical protein
MVRLAFHDAATFAGVGVAGGPDGCIDLSDKEGNGGLEQTVALLDCVRANSSARALGAFSRADLWALAGSAAALGGMRAPPIHAIRSCAVALLPGLQSPGFMLIMPLNTHVHVTTPKSSPST